MQIAKGDKTRRSTAKRLIGITTIALAAISLTPSVSAQGSLDCLGR
jgi:hypothetical protein